MFCSDPMSGSHFIVQTSKFLLIDATAVTLGQGQQKVIQYISPDSYILCAKYLRFSSNVLTWEAKVVAAADAADTAAAAETNWKHKVTPDRVDLITVLHNNIIYAIKSVPIPLMLTTQWGFLTHWGRD